MPSHFWFIRHAESAANAGEKTSDPSAIAITEKGEAQALALSKQIIEQPDLVITSPFIRTQQTAQATIEKFPDTPTEVWPIQEFTYLNPEKCRNMSGKERRPMVEAYWARAEPDYNDGGVESFNDILNRIESMWQRLNADYQNKTVLIFAHGIFIKMLEWKLSNTVDMSMANFHTFHEGSPMTNCSILKCTIEGNGNVDLAW